MKFNLIITIIIIFLAKISIIQAQNEPDFFEVSRIIAHKNSPNFEQDCNSLLQKTYPDYFKDATPETLETRLTQAACHLAYTINMTAIKAGMQTYTSLADLNEAKRDIDGIKAELEKFNPAAIEQEDTAIIEAFFNAKAAEWAPRIHAKTSRYQLRARDKRK